MRSQRPSRVLRWLPVDISSSQNLLSSQNLFEAFSKTTFATSCGLLRGENWITLNIDPVCCLCRDVAAQAIFFVVSCDLFIGRVGFEKGPSPAVTPERITGITSFFV